MKFQLYIPCQTLTVVVNYITLFYAFNHTQLKAEYLELNLLSKQQNSTISVPRFSQRYSIYANRQERSIQAVIGIDPETECYPQLDESSGPDSLLSEDEYVSFLNLSYDNHFKEVSNFSNLPDSLKEVFNKIACEYCKLLFGNENLRECFCDDGVHKSLVNATIVPNSGNIFSMLDSLQTVYIYEFCEETMFEMRKIITVSPSTSPTMEPSFLPSSYPSLLPTSLPSNNPTRAPTSLKVTLTPSSSPSISPSLPNVSTLTIPFTISNSAGIKAEDIATNVNGIADSLNQAFEVLVKEVINSLNEGDSSARNRQKRHLTTTRILKGIKFAGSYLDSYEGTKCPEGSPSSLNCISVQGNAKISTPNTNNVGSVMSTFRTSMANKIDAGSLRTSDGLFFALPTQNAENNEASVETTGESSLQSYTDAGLGNSGIAAFAAASFGLFIIIYILIIQRRRALNGIQTDRKNNDSVYFIDLPKVQVKPYNRLESRSIDSLDEDDNDGSLNLSFHYNQSDKRRSGLFHNIFENYSRLKHEKHDISL